MDKTLAVLETYRGRDKILRFLCYSTKCAAGLVKSPQHASQLDNFSKQLSTARTCFRLLDDIPAIMGVITRCAKQKEDDMKTLFWIENIVDVIFSPIDHISWAIDHEILISRNSAWGTSSTLCWVISLYINLIKISVKLSSNAKQKMENSSQIKDREFKKKLEMAQWQLQLSALKCFSDLLFAVNYLPKGFLWAQYFNKWQVGALGTCSSIISLYQLFKP